MRKLLGEMDDFSGLPNRGMFLIEKLPTTFTVFRNYASSAAFRFLNLHSLPQLVMKQIAFLIALVAVLALCSAPVAAKPTEVQSTEGFVCDGSSLGLFCFRGLLLPHVFIFAPSLSHRLCSSSLLLPRCLG